MIYISKQPCRKCGSVERYADGSCVECRRRRWRPTDGSRSERFIARMKSTLRPLANTRRGGEHYNAQQNARNALKREARMMTTLRPLSNTRKGRGGHYPRLPHLTDEQWRLRRNAQRQLNRATRNVAKIIGVWSSVEAVDAFDASNSREVALRALMRRDAQEWARRQPADEYDL